QGREGNRRAHGEAPRRVHRLGGADVAARTVAPVRPPGEERQAAMTQALKAKDPRDIEHWKHKARALLLPPPLAILDRANEEGRARAICEALGLALSAREDLHERCAVDAAGVHVPVTTPSWPATNAPLGGLLHPLSGTPSPGTPPVTTLDELRQEHARWHGSLLPRLECLNRASPAQAHRVYAALWQEVQHSARWLACCPGH